MKNPMVLTAHSIQVPRPCRCSRVAGATHSAKAVRSHSFQTPRSLPLARVGSSFSFAKIPPSCPFLFSPGHPVPRTKPPCGLGALQREHPSGMPVIPSLPLTTKLVTPKLQRPLAGVPLRWPEGDLGLLSRTSSSGSHGQVR